MADTALKPLLQGIANAIRYQEGSTGKIYPETYEQRIRAIRSIKTEGICNVNLTAAPSKGGQIIGGGMCSPGMSINASAFAADGYLFKGWQENGASFSADKDITLDITKDRYLTALFEARQVPDGYTQVEYIESPSADRNATRYILTETAIDFNTDVITLDFQCTTQGSYSRYIMGFGYNHVDYTTSGSYLYFNNSEKVYLNPKNRFTLVVDLPNKVCRNGDSSTSVAVNSSKAGSLELFNWNKSGPSIAGKLYACQVESGSVLKAKFVPCISPDGKIGVYETVSKKFIEAYAQLAGFKFTAGPAL